MSSAIDNLAKTLQQAISDRDKRKTSSYDGPATVTSVDGDILWVRVPGGEDRTPVQRTIDASEGDDIVIRISDHKAYAVGNSSAPPSREIATQALNNSVQANQAISETNEFVTNNSRIVNAQIENVVAKNAELDNVVAQNARITNSFIDGLTAEGSEIRNSKIEGFTVIDGVVQGFQADRAEIRNGISANSADIGTLRTSKADINFANVDVATITQSWIQDMFVQGGFVANDGTVFHLTGVHISGDLIDANTIKADALLLQGQNGLYYKINVDELGKTTADSDPKYQTGIDGKAIIAHSITATEITTQNIQGAGGWINFASGTFAYTNATTGHGIVWDGDHLTISTDRVTIGEVDLSDAIDSALNAAEVAMSTLIYDHTYEYVRDANNNPISANFTAFLYRGGTDVKTEYPASSFTWYLKKEEKGTGVVTETRIGTGYTCSVNLSDCGYGAEIVGKCTIVDDANALTNDGDNLTDANNNNLSVRATGDSVRVRDLSVSTTIFPTDKLMMVGAEDEHLVSVQTLQDYLNANLTKQVLFNTTAYWDSQTTLVSDANTLYIYTDHQFDSDGHRVAGIKAGDGNAYVVDLPFTDAIATEHIADTTRHITASERSAWNDHVANSGIHITSAERTAWNDKVRCYYAGTENLVFTTL